MSGQGTAFGAQADNEYIWVKKLAATNYVNSEGRQCPSAHIDKIAHSK